MSLFPMFSAPAASQRLDLPLYTDVAMNYDAMEPRWESGEPVIVTGLEAVKSWAVRAILAARYRWPIFDWSYGCELEALVGQPYLAETKRSEASRYIQEALLMSPYITVAQVVELRFEGSTLHATADLTTVYGRGRIYV